MTACYGTQPEDNTEWKEWLQGNVVEEEDLPAKGAANNIAPGGTEEVCRVCPVLRGASRLNGAPRDLSPSAGTR